MNKKSLIFSVFVFRFLVNQRENSLRKISFGMKIEKIEINLRKFRFVSIETIKQNIKY